MSTTPATGPWVQTIVSDQGRITDLDCVSDTFCVAIENNGNARIAAPPKEPEPPAPAGPSRDEMAAALRRALVPHGRAARIGSLLRRKRYTASFDARVGGTIELRWVVHGKLLTIASGRGRLAGGGKAKVTMRLTRRGRALLRRRSRLSVSASGVFRPDGGAPVIAGRAFALRR
jgi:hypothetical protein